MATRIGSAVALGAVVRARRLATGSTQAQLAASVGVSRAWLIRLEEGHPRAELYRVIAVVSALGLEIEVTERHLTDAEREEQEFLNEMFGSDDD